jgi:hypothetical protein
MTVYTFSQARQRLSALLKQARQQGEVRIRRRDGQVFVVRPAPGTNRSPLDVPGIDVALKPGDLLAVLRESRRSTERFVRPASSSPRRGRAKTRGSGNL